MKPCSPGGIARAARSAGVFGGGTGRGGAGAGPLVTSVPRATSTAESTAPIANGTSLAGRYHRPCPLLQIAHPVALDALDLRRQRGFEEAVDIAIQHRAGIARLDPGPQVLHHLVGL